MDSSVEKRDLPMKRKRNSQMKIIKIKKNKKSKFLKIKFHQVPSFLKSKDSYQLTKLLKMLTLWDKIKDV